MNDNRPILVVGAGLAGAVYARCLADNGFRVHVIDKRAHVAGNAYDEVDSSGIRIHKYGPHLFHTANERVLSFVRRFAEWIPYTHRVRALLPSGDLAPLPINLDTMNAVFGTALRDEGEASDYLASIAIPHANPCNAAEYLESKIGRELTNLFFRPYTKKMWLKDLEELDASIVKRLPLRFNRVDTYFDDRQTQILPALGYTNFVKQMLDSDRIAVSLSTAYQHGMAEDYQHCFSSMSIDEYYEYSLGVLPYRSIRFHHRLERDDKVEDHWRERDDNGFSVVNFTDAGPFTRETAWARLPNHIVEETSVKVFTKEEPCNFTDNDFERYYPIKSRDGVSEALYEKYKKLAEADASKLTFIGRCGTYQYLDMDQVINQSIAGFEHWMKKKAEPIQES